MQLVYLLAQMVAAEMAAMHVEQAAGQREQLWRLQDQTEHQTEMLERLVRVTLPPPPCPLAVAIYWMGEGDDPWVFLEAFRATGVTVASGRVAQKAALSLPPASRRSFKDICRAVMDNLGLYPEDYHQQFRDSQMMAEDQLFTWAWSSSWTA